MLLSRKEGSKVVVFVNGKVNDTFALKEDTEYTVRQDNGAYNTFIIKDGHVDMTDANCPDKLCVKDRDIQYNNETIVCLPNNVVLQITDGEDNDVDIIAQ
jgi:hypothetical protein